jgi:hypothetical protein
MLQADHHRRPPGVESHRSPVWTRPSWSDSCRIPRHAGSSTPSPRCWHSPVRPRRIDQVATVDGHPARAGDQPATRPLRAEGFTNIAAGIQHMPYDAFTRPLDVLGIT